MLEKPQTAVLLFFRNAYIRNYVHTETTLRGRNSELLNIKSDTAELYSYHINAV